MSPVGGVGINLAIQDAVAAANLLWEPLKRESTSERDLQRVQAQRMLPVRVTQAAQVFLQNHAVRSVLEGSGAKENFRLPLALRALNRWPWLRRLPARAIGLGVRPEHVGRKWRLGE